MADEEIEFDRIAWARVACRNVMEHRDRNRIVSSVVDEPADCRIVIDAIKGDLMAVFGQDGLQKVEIELDGSPCLGEQDRVVGRLPQSVGCWIQDDVGHRVGGGKLMLGHEGIYPINSMTFATVISDSDGSTAPLLNLRRDEFFGIEARGIARITSSLGDLAQKVHRGIIGDKEVQPPTAVRVRFHTVEELAVTMRDQCIPKALAIVIDRLTVGAPGLRSAATSPYASRIAGSIPRSAGNGWSGSCRAMWPRGTNGPWVMAVFSRTTLKSLFQNYELGGSGRRGDTVGGQ